MQTFGIKIGECKLLFIHLHLASVWKRDEGQLTLLRNGLLINLSLCNADEAHTIHLKCNIASFSDACSVLDHQVPVFICDKDALVSSEWDITTQEVGKYHISCGLFKDLEMKSSIE